MILNYTNSFDKIRIYGGENTIVNQSKIFVGCLSIFFIFCLCILFGGNGANIEPRGIIDMIISRIWCFIPYVWHGNKQKKFAGALERSGALISKQDE